MKRRYLAAPTLVEYIGAAETNQDLWTHARRRADVPAEILERARRIEHPRHLLVLAEDWCGDAFNTVPVLDRLAELVPSLDLRVLGRDDNPDLMDAHLTGTSRSIPVVMVLDEHYREMGWWGPRPAPIQEWFLHEGQNLPRADRYREMRRMYARDRGWTTLEEVLRLLEMPSLTPVG